MAIVSSWNEYVVDSGSANHLAPISEVCGAEICVFVCFNCTVNCTQKYVLIYNTFVEKNNDD